MQELRIYEMALSTAATRDFQHNIKQRNSLKITFHTIESKKYCRLTNYNTLMLPST